MKLVEMRFKGVENTIRVPEHRVKRYQTRGWRRVTKTPDGSQPSGQEPGKGNDTEEA
jgi:hypothetical protein